MAGKIAAAAPSANNISDDDDDDAHCRGSGLIPSNQENEIGPAVILHL
jgi:hypothetical protein